jgi:serine protease Do
MEPTRQNDTDIEPIHNERALNEASAASNENRPRSEPKFAERPQRSKRPIVLILALLVGLVGGFGGGWLQDYMAGEDSPLSVLQTAEEDGNTVVTANEESIATVAKSVSPSVVSIVTSSSQLSPLYNRTIEQEGAGTGMIVSSNGYVLTNKHVVAGADTVSIVLRDGTIYKNVQVLGTDPLNDVAFLKIKNANDLPAVTLGDSKTVRIGQTVVAIGNALGQYQNTVTSGIISGTGRPVIASADGTASGSESLNDLIQTDAAINSGNSGGPLLNLKGQVIGINTAIAQDAQGIGFAIPIGATKGILQHVIKTGKVERAYLGVQYVSITPEIRERYDLPVGKGDYIFAQQGNSVQSGGPADKAGVKNGDIITQVNGHKVGDVASVSSLVSEYEPGDKVNLTILRDGKTIKLTATLGTYKD